MKKKMNEDSVRVIKISKNALFEFIYEKMLDDQELLLDVSSSDIVSSFDMDWENGQLIFCACKEPSSDFYKEIDLKKLMRKLPDTTDSIYEENRYREYTKDELMKLSKE